MDEDGESSDDDFRNDPYGVKKAKKEEEAAERKKWEANRKALEAKDKKSARRQALIAGLSKKGVGSYTSSSHRGEAGERVVFEDAKLLYVKTSSETSKFGSKYKSADRCIELTPAGIARENRDCLQAEIASHPSLPHRDLCIHRGRQGRRHVAHERHEQGGEVISSRLDRRL